MHHRLFHIRRTLKEYIRREKGKDINKKGDARSEPPSRTARLACVLAKRAAIKMDFPDKKGLGIIGRAYGMIKGGLQKKK